MKHILHLTFVLAVCIFFTSCVKTLDVPPQSQTYTLTGNWYISNASENYGNGWAAFNPGINGTFTFFDDGTAQYSENNGYLPGSWMSKVSTDGYYDDFGNYYTNQHETLEIQAGSSNNNSVYLYFDDFSFADQNTFIATYYTGKSIERYTFDRE